MGFGAEIKNDSDGILLDAEYSSIRLYAEGTIQTDETGPPGIEYKGTYTLPEPIPAGEPILFCVQPLNRWITGGLRGSEDSSGNYYYDRAEIHAEVNDNFNFKIFTRYDYGTPSVSGNHGLQIFDGQGEKVYDSRIVEGLYLDAVYVPGFSYHAGTPGPKSHAYAPDAYYTLNLFPNVVNTTPGPTSHEDAWRHNVFRQGSDTSIEFDIVSGLGPAMDFGQTGPDSTMMILDDSNF